MVILLLPARTIDDDLLFFLLACWYVGFTNKVIKERRQTLDVEDAQTKRRQAFLDLLLTATQQDGSNLTDQDIREEVDSTCVCL